MMWKSGSQCKAVDSITARAQTSVHKFSWLGKVLSIILLSHRFHMYVAANITLDACTLALC